MVTSAEVVDAVDRERRQDSQLWKKYFFAMRHTSVSMLHRSLSFEEFTQALLLIAVKKYGVFLKGQFTLYASHALSLHVP